MRWNRVAALLLLCALALPSPSWALIVKSGNGNTSAPAGDLGWSYVGSLGNGSAIYLGNKRVLTAKHVNTVGSYVLDGVAYTKSGRSWTIDNPAPQLGLADLRVVELTSDPGLPWLTIADTPISLNQQVTIVATGVEADGGEQVYGPGLRGFDWSTTRSKLWGQNIVTHNWAENIDDGRDGLSGNDGDGVNDLFISNTRTFQMEFDRFSLTHEAQAANNDSGGGVFVDTGSGFELAGMVVATAAFVANASVYGDLTYAVDLAYYKDSLRKYTVDLGDVTFNGVVDVADVDAIQLATRSGSTDILTDIDEDGNFAEQDDFDALFGDVLGLLPGDADGDYDIDNDDIFAILGANKHAQGFTNAVWTEGDFDNDGDVDNDDVFQVLETGVFGLGDYRLLTPSTSFAATAAVPEPASILIVTACGGFGLLRRRGRAGCVSLRRP